MSSDTALAPNINLYQSDEHYLPVPENLPHTTHVLPDALLVTEPNRKPEGRGESQSAVGLAKLPPGLVLVEDYTNGQLGHSHAHPDIAEAATNCASLCDTKHVI